MSYAIRRSRARGSPQRSGAPTGECRPLVAQRLLRGRHGGGVPLSLPAGRQRLLGRRRGALMAGSSLPLQPSVLCLAGAIWDSPCGYPPATGLPDLCLLLQRARTSSRGEALKCAREACDDCGCKGIPGARGRARARPAIEGLLLLSGAPTGNTAPHEPQWPSQGRRGGGVPLSLPAVASRHGQCRPLGAQRLLRGRHGGGIPLSLPAGRERQFGRNNGRPGERSLLFLAVINWAARSLWQGLTRPRSAAARQSPARPAGRPSTGPPGRRTGAPARRRYGR